MWAAQIRDKTARNAQSDLDRHCPVKPLVSSTVWKSSEDELDRKGKGILLHVIEFDCTVN